LVITVEFGKLVAIRNLAKARKEDQAIERFSPPPIDPQDILKVASEQF
jgi:hypothetical protein